ncbi:MAG: menaquinone-dependent protoporphyrinogen IX dehydrogenase [Candidatus Accumulibacter sp.]|jgi:menaquinone-dependent protoporphyrinogen oxidase|nr:menaquinone-dependent protoporphyrinogen IX dehydrogenase [Accumulibacter sp.]
MKNTTPEMTLDENPSEKSMPEKKPSRRVLLFYSSRFGHSRKIAGVVADEIRNSGLAVDVEELRHGATIDAQSYVGAGFIVSVRYGFFTSALYETIAAHKAWLDATPTLLMTVSLTARKPEKRDPAKHSYTRRLLKRTNWAPTRVDVVAGALEYPRYGAFDRACIRLIMLITGGEADGCSEIDYTDWDGVRDTARSYAKEVRAAEDRTASGLRNQETEDRRQRS